MTELSEKEARAEMYGLDFDVLVELAEEQGLPTAGIGKEDLIEMLLGKCAGCKKKE